MTTDLIAALERQSLRMLISSKQDGDDYELIRAHIETLRLSASPFAVAAAHDAGHQAGQEAERANVVEWLRYADIWAGMDEASDADWLAKRIEAGAHTPPRNKE